MSTLFNIVNNVNTTLAAPITSTSATTLTLSSTTNAPSPTGGQVWPITLCDAATVSVFEIVYCTSRTGAVCTITRGQEGTAAATWLAADLAYADSTAAILNNFALINGSVSNNFSVAALTMGGALTGATTGSFSGAISSSSSNIGLGVAGFSVGTLGATTNAMAWSNAIGGTNYTLLGTGGGVVAGIAGSLLQLQSEPSAAVLMAIDGSGNVGFGGQVSAHAGLLAAGATLTSSGQVAVQSFSTLMTFDLFAPAGTWAFRNNASTNQATISAAGVYATVSDERRKENIAALTLGLDEILQLQPVTYDWIDSKKPGQGFIAQAVAPLIPLAVSVIDAKTGELGISDAFITPVVVRAIQQLSAEIKQIRNFLNY